MLYTDPIFFFKSGTNGWVTVTTHLLFCLNSGIGNSKISFVEVSS